MTMAAVIAAKHGILPKNAAAKSLAEIVMDAEKAVFYRNRLPDYQTPLDNELYGEDVNLFEWNFPKLVSNAGDGKFGAEDEIPEHFSTHYSVPDEYLGMPVAIIGAGAAGLAAGYEMMKLGLTPVFFEMQTQASPDNIVYARPFGRIYSWDYGGNGPKIGAGAGWYPTDPLDKTSAMPNSGNTHPWGRRVVELGGMRYPATHLTLRTYTDIFKGDYYYGDSFTTPWIPFRDPGLYKAHNGEDGDRGGVVIPSDFDTLVYDTVYHTKGITKDRKNPPDKGVYAETDRVAAGTNLGESNAAVKNLTNIYFKLLYGDPEQGNDYVGILTPILRLYSQYTHAENPTQDLINQIANEWQRLLQLHDKKSLREVLIAAGWQDKPAYEEKWGEQGLSLLEMFGEIGTGTGPFAMFYYSSFMELLRIALQAADSKQDYFRGGAGYQLQPFLTHFTPTKQSPSTCLWNETRNKVITNKVVAVESGESGGVVITTEVNGNRASFTFTAAIVTAGPAAMRSTDLFPNPDRLIPPRALSYIKRVRINNNSKIAINFPNLEDEPLSKAFWMDHSQPTNRNADLIVTTLTDKTIRQIYTFDNYHWATSVDEEYGSDASLMLSGTLMLNYGWDYNAQSWSADDAKTAVHKAWRQMTDIYGFGTTYDKYLMWALENEQYAFIVWERVDGFNAAWRMAQPGRGTTYGEPGPDKRKRFSEFQTMQTFGMTSYNGKTGEYTGLFIAGEASASPGLSGWVEGSIQTGLQAVAGIVRYLNRDEAPKRLTPVTPAGTSFALHAHPGDKALEQS